MLAAPGVWLAWSMIAFVVAIMSFVWRTGTSDDPTDPTARLLPPEEGLGPRIVITGVLVLGLAYLVMIVSTFRTYGSSGMRKRRARMLSERRGRRRDRATQRTGDTENNEHTNDERDHAGD